MVGQTSDLKNYQKKHSEILRSINMNTIEEILKALETIDYSVFTEEYIDDILDNRDNDPFDSEWCRVCDEIENLKNNDNYTKSNESEFLEITQKAFKILESNNCGELSSYISDDFGLIYDSLILNYKDEWLDKLIDTYKNRKIPTGELNDLV